MDSNQEAHQYEEDVTCLPTLIVREFARRNTASIWPKQVSRADMGDMNLKDSILIVEH